MRTELLTVVILTTILCCSGVAFADKEDAFRPVNVSSCPDLQVVYNHTSHLAMMLNCRSQQYVIYLPAAFMESVVRRNSCAETSYPGRPNIDQKGYYTPCSVTRISQLYNDAHLQIYWSAILYGNMLYDDRWQRPSITTNLYWEYTGGKHVEPWIVTP
jgi:hypothetical protein